MIYILNILSNDELGMPRAIEMHAHDPLRYVGDMLAWIHQTAASEAEFLFSLIETNPKETKLEKPGEDGMIYILIPLLHNYLTTHFKGNVLNPKKILNSTLDGVCRPFRVRILF
jgi:hypothetical protein